MIKRKLILIMENKPGALVRVVGLFHQRGYNIESLHVDPVDDFSIYKFIEERLDTKFKENDHLESTKHLFIKIPFEENIIIKIDLLFRNDYLSISLKSSQVNLPYLYNKKNTINR